MIDWFISWLQRFIQLGIDLAVQLVSGLLRAPLTAVERAGDPPVVRRCRAEEVLDLRHRVLRAGRPLAEATFPGDDAPQTRHWAALQRTRVVGVVSVMHAPETLEGRTYPWQLRGMAVDENLRGLHIGEKLLFAVHDEVAEPMWCNARANVVGFYEKYGWHATGPVFDVPNIGPHRKMVWMPS